MNKRSLDLENHNSKKVQEQKFQKTNVQMKLHGATLFHLLQKKMMEEVGRVVELQLQSPLISKN